MDKQKENQVLEFSRLSEQLEFGSSVFPSVVVNRHADLNIAETCKWIEANVTQIEAELSRSGAVLFRGFPIVSAETFDDFSAAFNYSSFTYKESLSNAVRINFTERVFTANEAPKEVEIYLHHEMAQTPKSPDKLFFFCKSAAEFGGATPICRSDKLFEELHSLQPALAQEFMEKGLKYTTSMPAEDDHESGQGRSWKSTLSVESKQQAEQKLIDLGYSWQWLDNGGLRAITPVLPAVKELPDGSHSFYNQLVAAYMGWEGVRENPSSAITFGDDSDIPISTLELVVELSKKFTYELQWQDQDVVLVDNQRTMHGRRPYSGERKRQVLVALAA